MYQHGFSAHESEVEGAHSRFILEISWSKLQPKRWADTKVFPMPGNKRNRQ
ncbi:hypothetical protein DPMN_090630 [Dreissena polymorpha]|uniref:Uncharacterized protein n=1 Tax=Dreissena polymorpha TaxID=45954 RepID=A0A9D4KYF5_DREPO|nr:hypothetical protein DPMN_090630 [Dreissena polymorpha]